MYNTAYFQITKGLFFCFTSIDKSQDENCHVTLNQFALCSNANPREVFFNWLYGFEVA